MQSSIGAIDKGLTVLMIILLAGCVWSATRGICIQELWSWESRVNSSDSQELSFWDIQIIAYNFWNHYRRAVSCDWLTIDHLTSIQTNWTAWRRRDSSGALRTAPVAGTYHPCRRGSSIVGQPAEEDAKHDKRWMNGRSVDGRMDGWKDGIRVIDGILGVL